jgi:hypothetical protein
MTPATAYLTFTLLRAEKLARAAGLELGAWLRRVAGDRRGRGELARQVSGMHGDRNDAIAYAQSEGPAFVLTPDGEVLRVERARDAALDTAAATEERAYSERLRHLTFREAIAS